MGFPKELWRYAALQGFFKDPKPWAGIGKTLANEAAMPKKECFNQKYLADIVIC